MKPTAMAMYLLSYYLNQKEGVVDATAGNGGDTLALAIAQSQGKVGNLYSFDVQDQAIDNTYKRLRENGFSVVCGSAGGGNGTALIGGGSGTGISFGGSGAAINVGKNGTATNETSSDSAINVGCRNDTNNAGSVGGSEKADAGESPQIHLIQSCHSLMNEHIPEEETISAVLFNLGYLPGGDKRVATSGETTCRAVLEALRRIRPQGAVVIVTYSGHEAGAAEKKMLIQMLSALSRKEYHASYINMINQPTGAPEVVAVTKKG